MRAAAMHRGRRARRIATDAPFTITSMLDMFTIILVFLLNFLDPSSAPEADVALPEASAEATVEPGPVLVITRERVVFDGVEVLRLVEGRLPEDVARTGRSIDPLLDRLAAAAERSRVSDATGDEGPASVALAVHCDRSVPFSVLGDLLYTAGQAGFGQFRFVVISDPG